jgi:hypothetical protein
MAIRIITSGSKAQPKVGKMDLNNVDGVVTLLSALSGFCPEAGEVHVQLSELRARFNSEGLLDVPEPEVEAEAEAEAEPA